MIRLLILADDFTGALDTGVQFAAAGAATKVMTGSDCSYSSISQSVEVLVHNLETRRLSPEAAHDLVHKCVSKAVKCGILYLYKKTDSALRGNVGGELAAMLQASGEKQLHFIPAYPQMGRETKNGIQYINEKPVAESVFGQDPFEPVTASDAAEIISLQTKMPVTKLPAGGQSENEGILLYDACTVDDILKTADLLRQKGKLHILAGCAGFASTLPGLLELCGQKPANPVFNDGIIIVCGSVNPITRAQLDYAEKNRFLRIRLTPRQKFDPQWIGSDDYTSTLRAWYERFNACKNCIIDTNELNGTQAADAYAEEKGIGAETIRRLIPNAMGRVLQTMLDFGLHKNLLLTGGDMLLGFLRCVDINCLTPICELFEGTVLSQIDYNGKTYNLLTKSGGFGGETLFCDLSAKMSQLKEIGA